MSKQTYTITRNQPGEPSEFTIRRNGRAIGGLDIHDSGYRDWSFVAGCVLPSRTTQRRLVAQARTLRAEGR